MRLIIDRMLAYLITSAAMKWTLTYYNNELQEEILALPKRILSKYLRIAEILEEFGPHLHIPYLKYAGRGLYEITVPSGTGRIQVMYYTVVQDNIIILFTCSRKDRGNSIKKITRIRERVSEVENGKINA